MGNNSGYKSNYNNSNYGGGMQSRPYGQQQNTNRGYPQDMDGNTSGNMPMRKNNMMYGGGNTSNSGGGPGSSMRGGGPRQSNPGYQKDGYQQGPKPFNNQSNGYNKPDGYS